ncbi:MAG: serpin family protein [Phycisphaerae bacterium]|nr:serpin family protein [Phycisphaerae bacterium]
MKWNVVILSVLAVCATGGFADAQPSENTNEMSISEAINAFAVEAYGQFAEAEGNIVFSPCSIHTALAMTYVGARNQTARQMADVLHYGQGEEYFQRYGAFLKETKPGLLAKYHLYTANALWPQEGYPFCPEFLDINKKYFQAAMFPVEYEKQFEKARKRINGWVETKTKKRIQDLLPEGSLDHLTRLVLTNAVYFKGDWQKPFKKDSTRDELFFLLNGKKKTIPMMHQTGHLMYGITDELHLLRLPYKGNEISMIILLPKEKLALPKIEKQLTSQTLKTWLAKIGQSQRALNIHVSLPKFRVEYAPKLKKALRDLGMSDAFDIQRKADFSGMEKQKELYISDIFHKAFLQTDEKGTEAAAATAVVMKRKNGGSGRRYVEFRADHPFLFLVRHEKTGAILFLGRVVEP